MLKHDDFLTEIEWCIDQAFEESGKRFLKVQKEKYAFFSDEEKNKKNGVLVEKETLKKMVKFLLEHIFIQCGDKTFQQIIGIPRNQLCSVLGQPIPFRFRI